jgi:ferredoxin--NADP+ reductase
MGPMFDADTWTKTTLTERTSWGDGLFTFRVDATREFHAGQFARLALEVDGDVVWRAYSIGSAPNQPLEFFIVRVDDGKLTPKLDALRPGDHVYLHKKIAGKFTLNHVRTGGTLWLVSTGTGLAPYIAMLREGTLWAKFDHVVLVHGVRHPIDLGYHAELNDFARLHPLTYIPATTRERADGAAFGRITSLFDDGTLERLAGRKIKKDDTDMLLCGNPAMIKLMQQTLKERGLLLNSPRNREGQLHTERYW